MVTLLLAGSFMVSSIMFTLSSWLDSELMYFSKWVFSRYREGGSTVTSRTPGQSLYFGIISLSRWCWQQLSLNPIQQTLHMIPSVGNAHIFCAYVDTLNHPTWTPTSPWSRHIYTHHTYTLPHLNGELLPSTLCALTWECFSCMKREWWEEG